jgi:hypothetical protein
MRLSGIGANGPPSPWRDYLTVLGVPTLFLLVIWLLALTVPYVARRGCGYVGLPQ